MRRIALTLILCALPALAHAQTCGYTTQMESNDWGYSCAKRYDGILECWHASFADVATPPAYAIDKFSTNGGALVWIKASDDTLHYSLNPSDMLDTPCQIGLRTCVGGSEAGLYCNPGYSTCAGGSCTGALTNRCGDPGVNWKAVCATNADCPSYGYSDFPTGAETFIDIATSDQGIATACAIRTDGTLYCWGDNTEAWHGNKCHGSDTSDINYDGISCTTNADCTSVGSSGHCMTGETEPAGTFTSIDAAYERYCGIKTDGSLDCWGDLIYAGATQHAILTSVPAGTTYTKVEVSADVACALKANGDVVCWGDDTDWTGGMTPPAGPWTDLGVFSYTACATNAAKELHCWGDAYTPDGTDCNWVNVEGNEDYACLRDDEGNVTCDWDGNGQSSVCDILPPFCFKEYGDGYTPTCVGM